MFKLKYRTTVIIILCLFQPSGQDFTNPFTVNSEDSYSSNVFIPSAPAASDDTYNLNSLDTGFDTFSSGPAPSGSGSGAPATNYYGAAPATSHFATSTNFGKLRVIPLQGDRSGRGLAFVLLLT